MNRLVLLPRCGAPRSVEACKRSLTWLRWSANAYFCTYVVETIPRHVGLRYWRRDLSTRADVGADGPIAPVERQAILGWTTQPSPSGKRAAHLVYVEATNWARSHTPFAYLKYSAEGKDAQILVDRWVEVDPSMRPLEAALENRPFYVPRRRFVLQFLTPAGTRPREIEDYGAIVGPPSLRLPAETESRLSTAPKTCATCDD